MENSISNSNFISSDNDEHEMHLKSGNEPIEKLFKPFLNRY